MASNSSFDRGFDVERNELTTRPTPVIGRSYGTPSKTAVAWKKSVAMVVVVVMLASTFVMLAPSFVKVAPVELTPEEPAQTSEIGQRYVNYTLSNLFELYMKSEDYNDLGMHNETMGVMSWWDARTAYPYPDLFVRRAYPFTMLYDYYSANLPNIAGAPRMGYGLYSFYRIGAEADNLVTVATGSGKDPGFIPMLNPSGLSLDGGSVSWNWHLTYLTADEEADITAGSHYANTYYNVPAGEVGFGGGDADDGWWSELKGKATFDRNAAKKFLNLPCTGSLITEFNSANSAGAVNSAWVNHWIAEANGPSGIYDIYVCYDWPLDSGSVDMYLSVDPTSTADSLTLRMWGRAWGYEVLMMRILERAGVMQFHQSYAEDFFVNGTIGSEGGDLDVRCTSFYKVCAWKDPLVWNAAWNLDTWHIDAMNNTGTHLVTGWRSHYYYYYAKALPGPDYLPMTKEWTPGTVNFGASVLYWQPPEGYNLTTGERLVVKLGDNSRDAVGYEPYAGTVDTIDSAKVTELTSHAYWGELVMGHSYPSLMYSYYDPVKREINMSGPLVLNADPQENTQPETRGKLNASGSPQFIFAVSRVSYYQVEILESGPYLNGVDYTLRVTAKNRTQTVQNNHTVVLSTNNAGTTYGDADGQYTFNWAADGGVWTTTIRFGEARADTYVLAADENWTADVNGMLEFDVTLIPEFSTLLLPVLGAMAIFFVVRRKSKKKDA